jgi:pyrimidine-nucleoside phosphorylase
MRAVDLIRKKREGHALAREEVQFFVEAVVDGTLPDYQIAAWLMAVMWRGMDPQETAWLTDAMARSGERLDWSMLPGPTVDKHSTGGVGDKTSLALAPIVAACGAFVPMMSGRGLGHTGGTLDKLEAIPGLRTMLPVEAFRAIVAQVGCAIVGQTDRMVPADRRLYALRDVTATVESLGLITASIMSKKIAEGVSALVLDVKSGRGAFMKTDQAAGELAAALVQAGRAAGVRTQAVVSRMETPIGRAVGNALEVAEAIVLLRGEGPHDLRTLVEALAVRMTRLAGLAASDEEALRLVTRAVASGEALERLRRMIQAQGGDPRVVDDPGRLPSASHRHALRAVKTGFVTAIDAERCGLAALHLGAGRTRMDDAIDAGVGLEILSPVGTAVSTGDAVILLHHRDGRGLDEALALVQQAVVVAEAASPPHPLILSIVS